jgi:ribonuclease BN (tRNA processing enzyme)
MCDFHAAAVQGDDAEGAAGAGRGVSRRTMLGAAGTSAAALAAAGLATRAPLARAATGAPAGQVTAPGLSVTLLGTAGGPPPLAARFGISTVVTVNGRNYVVDCGRGAVSQYVRAGLDLAALDGIFLTHLHSDHVVDYFSFPLLAATTPPAFGPVAVYGPGPAGADSLVPGAPGPVPGTAALTSLSDRAFAASGTFFIAEHIGEDPAALVKVTEIMPPAGTGASQGNPAPAMKPFPVLETSDLTVTAILVPHGQAYPAYAYRFDTEHGSVALSGDTTQTPNVVTLARGAGLLVHEVVDLAAFSGPGFPPALVAHLRAVHTDVTALGAIAAEAGVRALAATHLSPADPALLPADAWRKLLRDSARTAGYRGGMILGEDLMRIQVTGAGIQVTGAV